MKSQGSHSVSTKHQLTESGRFDGAAATDEVEAAPKYRNCFVDVFLLPVPPRARQRAVKFEDVFNTNSWLGRTLALEVVVLWALKSSEVRGKF